MLATNIAIVTVSSPGKTPRTSTRERLQTAALELFEERGFDRVTVEEIAAAAGVSHMTFFRHFGSKDRVLLDDPFDPMIAVAVAATDPGLPAIERIARGMMTVLPHIDPAEDGAVRRRLRIAIGSPMLEAGIAANTRATQEAIVATGASPSDRTALRIAAAGCLAGVTVALLEWAGDDSEATLADAVGGALRIMAPGLTVGEAR
jgi:AcrR family transcriptional regulator